MNSISIFADSEFDGVRIDKYLSVVFSDLSRSFIQKAIDCGNVSINGKTVAKNYKLKTDERIEYIPLEPVKLEVKAQNSSIFTKRTESCSGIFKIRKLNHFRNDR